MGLRGWEFNPLLGSPDADSGTNWGYRGSRRSSWFSTRPRICFRRLAVEGKYGRGVKHSGTRGARGARGARVVIAVLSYVSTLYEQVVRGSTMRSTVQYSDASDYRTVQHEYRTRTVLLSEYRRMSYTVVELQRLRVARCLFGPRMVGQVQP